MNNASRGFSTVGEINENLFPNQEIKSIYLLILGKSLLKGKRETSGAYSYSNCKRFSDCKVQIKSLIFSNKTVVILVN